MSREGEEDRPSVGALHRVGPERVKGRGKWIAEVWLDKELVDLATPQKTVCDGSQTEQSWAKRTRRGSNSASRSM